MPMNQLHFLHPFVCMSNLKEKIKGLKIIVYIIWEKNIKFSSIFCNLRWKVLLGLQCIEQTRCCRKYYNMKGKLEKNVFMEKNPSEYVGIYLWSKKNAVYAVNKAEWNVSKLNYIALICIYTFYTYYMYSWCWQPMLLNNIHTYEWGTVVDNT